MATRGGDGRLQEDDDPYEIPHAQEETAVLRRELSEVRREREFLREKLADARATEMAACELMVAKERVKELESRLSSTELEHRESDRRRDEEFRSARESLERSHRTELERLAAPTVVTSPMGTHRVPASSVSSPCGNEVVASSLGASEPAKRKSHGLFGFLSVRGRKDKEKRASLAGAFEDPGQTGHGGMGSPSGSVSVPSTSPASSLHGESPRILSLGQPVVATPSAAQSQSHPSSPPRQAKSVSPPPLPEKPECCGGSGGAHAGGSAAGCGSGSTSGRSPTSSLLIPCPLAMPCAGTPPPSTSPGRVVARGVSPSGWKPDADASLAAEMELVSALDRALERVADIGRCFERMRPDDPRLRSKVETTVCLMKLVSQLPSDPSLSYAAPTIDHDNEKYVQLRLRVHKMLWEIRVKLSAVHARVVSLIARRKEELGELAKISQLVSSLQASVAPI